MSPEWPRARVQMWDDCWVSVFDSANGWGNYPAVLRAHESLHYREMWPDGSMKCGDILTDGRLIPW